MKASFYDIDLRGCDDSTRFRMRLTPYEAKTLERLAKTSRRVSTYCCMPTITVSKSKRPKK